MTNFAKHSILHVSQSYKCASDKTKQKLVVLSFISQKIRIQSLKISCIFKFIFIFALSKITNSVHVGLISNWFTHAFEYVWHLLVQIHHNSSRTTLCNFVLTKTRNNLKPAETSWSHPETTWNHMKPPESSHITVLFTWYKLFWSCVSLNTPKCDSPNTLKRVLSKFGLKNWSSPN